MPIDFRRDMMNARYLSPDGAQEIERQVEVRVDPLLGATARVAEGVRLPLALAGALDPIRASDAACPFCPEQLERATPRILPAIAPEGRIREGETTLVPNLVPYGQYAAVAPFSPRHWLALEDFTPQLLADNLRAAQRYVAAVFTHDPAAAFAAYNINYLYPSGGSLPHPHAQIYVDPHPTTMMRLQSEASARYRDAAGQVFWEDLAAIEAGDARSVGRTGNVTWFTPFAPLGFNEVRAVVHGREHLLALDQADLDSLAEGIGRVLDWYGETAHDSFNLVLYSGRLDGEPGFRVNLAIITRSALTPYYRSDAMYLERLHWEAAVDRRPEDVAADLRPRFAPGRRAG